MSRTVGNQLAELVSTDGAKGDSFGSSVAISGKTAVVGASGNSRQGAAYVFTRTGTTWSQTAKLTASDGVANDGFGTSVAISGKTAVVGAGFHQVGSNVGQGAAYVFTQTGTTWSQTAELTASDGAPNDAFGNSVAISGGTAVVGADFHQVGGNHQQGAAYVFTKTGTTWSQTAELTASDGANGDQFGNSVAISRKTVVVGALSHQVGRNVGQGAAYVFTQTGTMWSQTAELTASDGAATDYFGQSVAISEMTAVVGPLFHRVGSNSQQGATYVFTKTGTIWSQTAELTASDGAAGDEFGSSVAISEKTMVAGAPIHRVGRHSGQGAAYVFTQTGTMWSQTAELTASDGAAFDDFGGSVAISGRTAIAGARFHRVGRHSGQGAAYVFAA